MTDEHEETRADSSTRVTVLKVRPGVFVIIIIDEFVTAIACLLQLCLPIVSSPSGTP